MKPLTLLSAAIVLTGSLVLPGMADEAPGVIEEILRLRQQMNATQPATPLLRSNDQQFRSEFERLATSDASNPGPLQPFNTPTPAPPTWPTFDAGQSAFPRSGQPLQPLAPGSRKSLLRNTAFELDKLAHQLEGSDLWDQADQLRGVASKLRHNARHNGQPPVTGAFFVPTPPQPTPPQPTLQTQPIMPPLPSTDPRPAPAPTRNLRPSIRRSTSQPQTQAPTSAPYPGPPELRDPRSAGPLDRSEKSDPSRSRRAGVEDRR